MPRNSSLNLTVRLAWTGKFGWAHVSVFTLYSAVVHSSHEETLENRLLPLSIKPGVPNPNGILASKGVSFPLVLTAKDASDSGSVELQPSHDLYSVRGRWSIKGGMK